MLAEHGQRYQVNRRNIMEAKYIKITQATHRYSDWYKNLVGKEFEVFYKDNDMGCYVIENIDGTGNVRGCIFFEDCVEIDSITEENKFIPPAPPKTQQQIMQETLDALILNSLS